MNVLKVGNEVAVPVNAAEKVESNKAQTVSQVPNVTLSDPVDTLDLSSKNNEAQFEKKASVAKKAGVGVASFLVPGLGQFINGDAKKGIAFMAANIACNLIGFAVLGPVALVPSFIIETASCVDAVKNA